MAIARVIAVGLTLAFAGCATELRSVRLGDSIEPEIIPGKVFVPGKSEANVGDVMLTAGEYSKEASRSKIEAFSLSTSVIAVVKHKTSTFEFSLPAGDYRLHSRANGGSYYQAPSNLSAMNSDTRTGYGGIFVPSGSSKATEFYWNWGRNMSGAYQARLTAPVAGIGKESIINLNDGSSSGPRATLTYAGVAAGQIRFVYKEFTADGLARPAFTQEVSLDYKPGGIYGYKDAQFTVESADSTHINFTLIRPL